MLLTLLTLLTACGGADGEDGPEAAARAAYEALRAGDYACPADYTVSLEELRGTFRLSAMGMGGFDSVCQYQNMNAADSLGQRIKGSSDPFGRFEIESEGTLAITQSGVEAPAFVEGTAYGASGGNAVHFNRLVRIDGRWSVLVLFSHPTLSQ